MHLHLFPSLPMGTLPSSAGVHIKKNTTKGRSHHTQTLSLTAAAEQAGVSRPAARLWRDRFLAMSPPQPQPLDAHLKGRGAGGRGPVGGMTQSPPSARSSADMT